MWSLREEVFIVEQKCLYQDADGRDLLAQHLLGYRGTELIAYARVLPGGTRFPEISIGRVLTSPRARRSGAGRALMEEAIARIGRQHGPSPIRISAQAYLEKFYASLGFVRVSDSYLEDGIPHYEMLRRA